MRRMKLIKKLSAALFAFVIMIGLMNMAPMKTQAYTYHFRLFAGNQGAHAGEVIFEDDFALNERATFKLSEIKKLVDLGNSKYYIKGIRESGRDNNTVGLMSIPITKDIDYVVAYGIKGTEVEYTVNFRDASGKELKASETFYGNVGDKPVLAYQYVDGYQPQAYNLTKTLKKGGNNDLTFVYKKVEEPKSTTVTPTPHETPEDPAPAARPATTPTPAQQSVNTTTTVTTSSNSSSGSNSNQTNSTNSTSTTSTTSTTSSTNSNSTAGQQSAGTAASPQSAGGSTSSESAGQAAAAGETVGENTENQANADEPQELIDLDETEEPLGEFETETAAVTETETVDETEIETETETELVETQQPTEEETSAQVKETSPGDLQTPENEGISTPVKAGISAVLVVGIGAAAFFLMKRRNGE